jgi:hypothetical protein
VEGRRRSRSGHFPRGAVIGEFRGSGGDWHPLNLDILPPSEDCAAPVTPVTDLDKIKDRILTLLDKDTMTKGALREGITKRLRHLIDEALNALIAEEKIALDGRRYSMIIRDEEPVPASPH